MLTLGLPLLTALEPQERVVLIAHELGHARNGDSRRGLLVGSAVRGLAELYGLLAPERMSELDDNTYELIPYAFFWVISRPVYWALLVEYHLLLRDSQRAEYLADSFAAKVAGTNATIGLHEKALLGSAVSGLVKFGADPASKPSTDLFEQIRAHMALVPDRERERRRRVARLEDARLDVTHPPTGLRIRLLEERPVDEPAVSLSQAGSDSIDFELAPLRPALQERLLDEYRDSLYYGWRGRPAVSAANVSKEDEVKRIRLFLRDFTARAVMEHLRSELEDTGRPPELTRKEIELVRFVRDGPLADRLGSSLPD